MNIFGEMCVVSLTYSYVVCMWVTVQYVLLLSQCLMNICSMSFALNNVLINFLCFFNLSLYICFIVLNYLLFIFVFRVFVLFCI
jgi:hypothetical protein